MDAKEKGIHILATGFEYDRIMAPLFGDYPVEKLIILKDVKSPYKKAHQLANHYIARIDVNFPKNIDIVELNIYDFDDVFSNVYDLIKRYTNTQTPIYINISAAPRLALTAIITAANFFEGKNIKIFYVKPEDYLLPELLHEFSKIKIDDQNKSLKNLRDLHKKIERNGCAVGVSGYEEIPLFPIESINKLDKKILNVLVINKGIKSIGELADKIDKKSKKRSTIQYRLNKLEKQGLIKGIRKERRLELEITKLGKIYLESCTK